ncbi:MAG: hypothetical protein FJZ47_19140 [Candidatus Tectomicrobia bacterium]|uniref:Lipocalin-like domain-containing protein n=1 Tax=Tectimicrobiota bacterium TaxID=2528274 RepID=A0A937W2X1_UNCTE|nr:hypothetical protein [Candidatus Tectomicrobia bacterium]
MASSNTRRFTFLRGSGFLVDLIGAWDLLADASSPWPAQKGFVIFKETQITAVIERHATMRRGIEGSYAVQGNRLTLTELAIDTAPDQGALRTGVFTIAGDLLTITWDATPPQTDTFRRRAPVNDGAVLPPTAIYASDTPDRQASGQRLPNTL